MGTKTFDFIIISGYLGSSSVGTNKSANTDGDSEGDKKNNSTSPSAEKYIPPHQKVIGSSPGSTAASSTNQNTVSSQSSIGGPMYSNSGSKPTSYKSRSPGNKAKEPVNDFFPFDNVSVYPASPNSPVKSPKKDYGFSSSSPRPKLHIPQSNVAQIPFYPPQHKVVDNVDEYMEQKPSNMTTAQGIESHYSLKSPEFYQTNEPPPTLHQHVPYYGHPSPTVSPIKQHVNTTKGMISKHQNDLSSRYNNQPVSNSYRDTYYNPEYRMGHETAQKNTRSTTNSSHSYFNHSNNNSYQNGGRSTVKAQQPSTPAKYQGCDPLKLSPESPDSPAIAAFNLGDLEHTQMTSTDHFHQQVYHEKLQALHEEAEEIAKESREQSELVNYSRYGMFLEL